MKEFGHKTPAMVLSDDQADQVIQILRRIFGSDRLGLGAVYESMREDTQSIQEDVFKEVKMISAEDAARLCALDVAGMSQMDVARAVERTKRAIYIMKGREPVFPAYQFDYQGPKGIISGIIKTLSPYRSNWEIAVWLWGSNGWLGGASPMELLDRKPILVLDAAFQEIVEESEDRNPE
jgi:hypothetical protein